MRLDLTLYLLPGLGPIVAGWLDVWGNIIHVFDFLSKTRDDFLDVHTLFSNQQLTKISIHDIKYVIIIYDYRYDIKYVIIIIDMIYNILYHDTI